MERKEFEALAAKAPREQKLAILAKFGPLPGWVKEAAEAELNDILYGIHVWCGAEALKGG